MHPILILALLNIVNGQPMGFRHPPSFLDSHNRRQLHNADFSSSTANGPAAITNPTYGSSSPAPGSSRSLPLTPRGPLDRRLISVSNPGAVMNGDPTLPPRAETGSRDADIDVHTMKALVRFPCLLGF